MAGITFVKVIAVGPGWNKVLASDGEVYTLKGDYNWRSNNPGNIEYGPFAISQGAIGSGKAPKGRARGFAIFPSYEAGQSARTVLQFESSSYKDRTVGAAIARYAPASDNNDVASYVRAVTSAAGVTADTKMSDLTPDQRAKFLAAQQKVEGFRPGTIMGEAGKPVPASVSQQFKGTPLPAADIPASVISPDVPPRRPDSVPGSPPMPRPRPDPDAPNSAEAARALGLGSTVLTGSASVKPKAPVAGLTPVVPGRTPAVPAAPAKVIVPALGKTVAQIGQEADSGRLNGYREVQAMGPKGVPGSAPAPAAKPAAARPSGATRVNVEYVRPDGTSRPAMTAGGGDVMPRKTTVLTGGKSPTERDEAAAAKKAAPLPAPAKLEFTKPVYKTVTVLNPDWKPSELTGGLSPTERDEKNAAITKLSAGAKGVAGAGAARYIQKRVLVTAAKPIAAKPVVKAAGKPAVAKPVAQPSSYAAQGKAIGDANRASPNPTYSYSGENNSFMPTSYQNSKVQQTGYR